MPRKIKRRRDRRSDVVTVEDVIERIIIQGPDYLDENTFVRLMIATAKLRDEREFADFWLDPQRTLEAAAHHFVRFRRRLARAARRNQDAMATEYDEYR